MKRATNYFRIAWTAFCGMVAVLLVVLWVRSYRTTDFFQWSVDSRIHAFLQSVEGFWIIGTSDKLDSPDGLQSVSIVGRQFVPTGFAKVVTSKSFLISFPYWVPLILASFLGGVPWLPYSNRFSLRTLLIATTLVAVGLGLIVLMVQ